MKVKVFWKKRTIYKLTQTKFNVRYNNIKQVFNILIDQAEDDLVIRNLYLNKPLINNGGSNEDSFVINISPKY